MKVLLVSIDLEYSLTYAYLRAYVGADPGLGRAVDFSLLELDPAKLAVYFDKNLESYRLLEAIERDRPDLLCFSCYLWNHLAVRELTGLVKALYPDLAVLVGGPEVLTRTAAAALLLRSGADLAVRGEGEASFAELCRVMIADGDPATVAGVSARRGEAVVHAPERTKLRDLDAIPSPLLAGLIDLELFDKVAADGTLEQRRHRRYIMETYRGCYMTCAYCQWGDGVAHRTRFSLERVQRELDLIIASRLQLVNFIDAMFGFSISSAKALLRGIVESKRRHGSGTVFIGYHNQDFFDDELFELYREAGFYPEIDLQSTNQQVLDLLGRGKWPPTSYERHRRAFRRHRVIVHDSSDLIIGLPGDSYDSLCASIDYFLARGIRVNLFHTSALPGTRLWAGAERHGVVFNPEPPRFVVRTASMPTRDIVRARLLGHGTELFQQYPNTMAAVLQHEARFGRPSALCEAFGAWLAARGELAFEMGQYNRDYRQIAYQQLARSFLEELTEDWPAWLRKVLLEIFRFEAERKNSLEHGLIPRPAGEPLPAALGRTVLELAPTVAVVDFETRVTDAVTPLSLVPLRVPGDPPAPDLEAPREEPLSICFYRGLPGFAEVRRDTGEVLRRLNGTLRLDRCLEASGKGTKVGAELERELQALARIGLVRAAPLPAPAGGRPQLAEPVG